MIVRKFIKKRRSSKKTDTYVVYICSSCREESETSIANYKKRKTQLCRPCSSKKTGKSLAGKQSKSKGIPRSHLRGENSKNWNGGKYLNKQGYVMILTNHGSVGRTSGWSNYRPEHIVVVENCIGRKLKQGECIHHIDGNKQNNSIENLCLTDSNKHHKEIHFSLQKVGYELFKSGVIKFNTETKQYYTEK